MRLGLFALVLLGCSRDATPPAPVRAPVPYLADAPFGPAEAGCLVAFLPGAGDDARSYVEHGFVERLRESNAKVDAWSVDATLEYYRGREIETRVREDVLLPATELGYRRIWLVGISMGGGGDVLEAGDDVHVRPVGDGELFPAGGLVGAVLSADADDDGAFLRGRGVGGDHGGVKPCPLST